MIIMLNSLWVSIRLSKQLHFSRNPDIQTALRALRRFQLIYPA
jgi:hypothetical protein